MTQYEANRWQERPDLLAALAAGELQINTGTVEKPQWDCIDEATLCVPYDKYRRKPKPRMIPLGPEDFGAVTWVRRTVNRDVVRLIVIIDSNGATPFGEPFYLFSKLCDDWEYSTDRKTWKRCEKEAT